MQSGYGGVSEMQRFLVDGYAPTLFSISLPPPTPENPAAATDIHTAPYQQSLKYHPLPHQHHQPKPQHQPHFNHFHSIPITQHLFHQSHHHQPHLQQDRRREIPHQQQQHLGLDPDSDHDNSSSPIRMMVRADGCGGEGDDGSESRFHPWQREEESVIKRPLDIDYINRNNNNNKRFKNKEQENSTTTNYKNIKDGIEPGQGNPATTSNYKLFSELEAIYQPGGGNHQAGSKSALIGDENLLVAAPSTGRGEVPASDPLKGSGRRKRKWRQRQLSSVAVFFEALVKQLIDHQEGLHRKFVEVMEKRDQERMSREGAWRREAAAKSAARSRERSLAAAREATIISFVEKITGESSM